jgi:catechol 2,3-dioxygenase-like lactoylglutathione lyase family enzyme
MDVLFVTGFSPIVADRRASRAFYADALQLPLEHEEGEYVFADRLPGVKHFGLWPLGRAAQTCFGTDDWPVEIPVPQATIEFEVQDVARAADELEEKGYALIHPAKTEPWGQTIARLLSPEGLLVGLSYAPSLHESSKSPTATES